MSEIIAVVVFLVLAGVLAVRYLVSIFSKKPGKCSSSCSGCMSSGSCSLYTPEKDKEKKISDK
jgi:hypothetical protein